jgi:peptidyl-prolyl cis-trans isomerase C
MQMKRVKAGFVLTGVLCVALSACGKKEPTGQVAATLNGKEITTVQLNAELNGFQAPNPQVRKTAERQALDQILARRALSDAAKKAKIDKTPGYAITQERANETLLVQTWQQQIAKSVPQPSKEEVDKFVAENPDVYGQRKIFTVDQVRMPRPSNPAIVQALQPLNTIPEVTAYLAANKIPFQESSEKIDALTANPKMVQAMMKLAPGAVFVVPSNNILTLNRITNAEVQPVAPDVAARYASAYLKNMHTQEAVARQFQSVIAAARKTVKYNPAYAPPAPPKPAAGAAGATPAAPAAPATTAPKG